MLRHFICPDGYFHRLFCILEYLEFVSLHAVRMLVAGWTVSIASSPYIRVCNRKFLSIKVCFVSIFIYMCIYVSSSTYIQTKLCVFGGVEYLKDKLLSEPKSALLKNLKSTLQLNLHLIVLSKQIRENSYSTSSAEPPAIVIV